MSTDIMDVGEEEFDSDPGECDGKEETTTRNMDEYDYTDEEEFWKPASQEAELKLQLDKILKITLIEENALE